MLELFLFYNGITHLSRCCSLKIQQILKRVSEDIDKHKVGQFARFSKGFESLLCVLTENKNNSLFKVFSLLILF